MNTRWGQKAKQYMQTPQGRRTVDQALNRVRAGAARPGRGGQLLRKLDTPATRQRLDQLLRGRAR